jgi:CheY-like chemotaxis protein
MVRVTVAAPDQPRRHVLVVDDDGPVRAVLARQLEALGVQVSTAAGGAQAIVRLDAERFDALFLDLDMPGVTGLDVLLHVQRAAPQMPVVVVTGTVEAERIEGAMTVLGKPVDSAALGAALKQALEAGGEVA